MAQMLVPSMQCSQMRVPCNLPQTRSLMPAKMWKSLLLNNQKAKTKKGLSSFRVFAVKSENSNGTVSRLEDLLNLDITPFTEKIIAEYIWYVTFLCCAYFDYNQKSKGKKMIKYQFRVSSMFEVIGELNSSLHKKNVGH